MVESEFVSFSSFKLIPFREDVGVLGELLSMYRDFFRDLAMRCLLTIILSSSGSFENRDDFDDEVANDYLSTRTGIRKHGAKARPLLCTLHLLPILHLTSRLPTS